MLSIWGRKIAEAQKTDEGLQKLTNDKFYKLLSSPIVQDTAWKVKELVNKLYCSGHIDLMTNKCLTIGLKQSRVPEFSTLTKFHKKTPAGKQSFLVAVVQQSICLVL